MTRYNPVDLGRVQLSSMQLAEKTNWAIIYEVLQLSSFVLHFRLSLIIMKYKCPIWTQCGRRNRRGSLGSSHRSEQSWHTEATSYLKSKGSCGTHRAPGSSLQSGSSTSQQYRVGFIHPNIHSCCGIVFAPSSSSSTKLWSMAWPQETTGFQALYA